MKSKSHKPFDITSKKFVFLKFRFGGGLQPGSTLLLSPARVPVWICLKKDFIKFFMCFVTPQHSGKNVALNEHNLCIYFLLAADLSRFSNNGC
jgi:hypothetical protein